MYEKIICFFKVIIILLVIINNIMKQKCLFFGNCQMHIIKEMIKQTIFNEIYDCDLFSSHIDTCDDLDKLYFKLNIYSFIAIQPHYNYKNNSKYNISSIVKHVNTNCKIIIIPSCYFKFYYPFLTYCFTNNDLLKLPVDYHDKNLIDLYNKNINNNDIIKTEYKKLLYNEDLISKKDLRKMAKESIDELKTREKKFMSESYGTKMDYVYLIISDFIENNYKKKLLFYSMNHPTYYLFEYIANELLQILGLGQYINNFVFYDPLDYLHPPLYKCIQKAVNFNISDFLPNINNLVDIDKITDMYLKDYDKIDNIRY